MNLTNIQAESSAFKAAYKKVFDDSEYDSLKLYREFYGISKEEFLLLVDSFQPCWKAWEAKLKKQIFRPEVFVISAQRMTNPYAKNANEDFLDPQEVEERYCFPTISFLGQFLTFCPKREGWGKFVSFDGSTSTSCIRYMKDLLIITTEQKEKALCGKLTNDEIGLPDLKFVYRQEMLVT